MPRTRPDDAGPGIFVEGLVKTVEHNPFGGGVAPVLWRPVFNLLEGEVGRTLILVTAHNVKVVPGRKTAVKESEWLANLLRPSVIPPQPTRVVRDLTRYPKTLVQERTKGSTAVRRCGTRPTAS